MLSPLNKKLSQLGQITIDLKVIPKSKINKILECYEQSNGRLMLKVKIQGVPEKGKVNTALIEFLSQELHLSKSHFQLISGLKSRKKILYISTLSNAL